MGVMSREYKPRLYQTVVLISYYSSQIIFGKYLSLMIYGFILTCIAGIYAGFTIWM